MCTLIVEKDIAPLLRSCKLSTGLIQGGEPEPDIYAAATAVWHAHVWRKVTTYGLSGRVPEGAKIQLVSWSTFKTKDRLVVRGFVQETDPS